VGVEQAAEVSPRLLHLDGELVQRDFTVSSCLVRDLEEFVRVAETIVLIIVLARTTSVPDLDPPDPYVFGPPGSVSTSQRYRSGSGSFYHQAKIVRKTLIPTVL
jgi:hypothetical protein